MNGRIRETHMDELDSILNEDFVNEPEVQKPEQVETPEAKADRERDEKGRFAPKGEEGASPAPVEEPAFDHAAVKGERERRQKAEQRARELEEQLQAYQQPAPPPVSLWEDEQQWQQQFGSQVVNQAVNQATFNAKLDMSEMMVRQANADFEEVKEAFLELAKDNPSLTQQALNDPHPWNKAYQIAKNHKAMQELGATDVESLKTKLREELRAEMATQPPVQIPRSLADAQSSRSNSGTTFRPPTLEEILGN